MWQAVINIFKCMCDIGPIFMAVTLVPLFFFFCLGLSRLTRSLDCLLNGKSQPGFASESYPGGNVVFVSPATHPLLPVFDKTSPRSTSPDKFAVMCSATQTLPHSPSTPCCLRNDCFFSWLYSLVGKHKACIWALVLRTSARQEGQQMAAPEH